MAADARPFWSRLHWQLFGFHLAIVGTVVVSLAAYISLFVERQLVDAIRHQLELTASTASLALTPALEAGSDVEPVLAAIQTRSDLRATVIGEDGRVLGDSGAPGRAHEIEYHGDRPEVLDALRTGFGTAQRFSETVGAEFLYVAKRVDIGDRRVVVRVAQPKEPILARLRGARITLAVVFLLAAALGTVLAFQLARRFTRPIEALSRAATAMSRGEFDVSLPQDNPGELEALTAAFDELRVQLADRLRQVEEEKAMILTVLRATSEGIIVVDATGRVLLANPLALELLGVADLWKSGEIENRMLVEVTRNPQLNRLVERSITQGTPVRDEVQSRRKMPRQLGVGVSPLVEDGAVRGAVAALEDLTQVRQLERVRQDFVANVSHELRTPVTAIRGWAETLTGGGFELQPMVEEALLTILHHGERLNALVNDLLALARVEALGIEDAFVEVDLGEVVEGILDGLEDAVASRGMSVTTSVDESVRLIRSEPRALEYMLRNLVENAIKYTPDRGRVSVRASKDDDGSLVIDVEDNGVGIEAHHLPRVFERFYRVDKGRSREVGGTGLGLSIVKHFASALGGTVTVKSTIGEGSTFTVRLPKEAWQPRPADGAGAHRLGERGGPGGLERER